MPILNVKVSGKKSRNLTQQITHFLLDATSQILKKERDVTVITIDYVDHDCWAVGEQLLDELAKNIFYCDIKITDETNTKNEKTKYIKHLFAGFEKILGNLHETSYVHVNDVRAAAYGYGGLTQEYRYQKSN